MILTTKRRGKGWSREGQYQRKEYAQKRAKVLRPRFDHVIVEKGTIGKAWGRPKTCYRVWVKG